MYFFLMFQSKKCFFVTFLQKFRILHIETHKRNYYENERQNFLENCSGYFNRS